MRQITFVSLQYNNIMKKCTKCNIEKPLTEFHKFKNTPDGLQYQCKICDRENSKKWNSENPEKRRESSRRYKKNNPAQHSEQVVRARKVRLEKDPTYKIEWNTRYRIKNKWNKYRNRGFQENENKFSDDLGCTMAEYKLYLESLFTEEMNWDNYGKGRGNWCIDHKVAPSKFDLLTEEGCNRAFGYKNTQPMMFSKNSRKGNK